MHDQTNEAEHEVVGTPAEPVVESNKEAGKTPLAKLMNKKNLITLLVVVLVIGITYSYKGLLVAATVNGSPISRLSVVQALEKSSGKQALNTLVTRKIIANEVRKNKITVSDEELNAGIKEIRDRIAAQGSTLEQVLESQGITVADFEKNQRIQIEVEKLLGDKIAVTDEEVDQYIKTNNLEIPKDQIENAYMQIRGQLKSEKLNTEGEKLVNSLRGAAQISYFVKY